MTSKKTQIKADERREGIRGKEEKEEDSLKIGFCLYI